MKIGAQLPLRSPRAARSSVRALPGRPTVHRPEAPEALASREEAPWTAEPAGDQAAARRLPVDAPGRRRLPLLLRRAWYGLNQAFRHLSARQGITPDQFTVLRTLREHGPLRLTQTDLVEKMSSDPNTIASLVRRMEQQGLIERQRNPADRRAHFLALREAGQRRYLRVRRQAVALQKTVLLALPEPDREPFLAQLELIGNACRQAAQLGRVARVTPPRRS